MPIIPKPPFPNVPKLPGVPQVPRSNNFPAGPPPALNAVVAIGRLVLAVLSKPAWGIYKMDLPPEPPDADGIQTVTVRAAPPPVITPDSFRRMGFRNEWAVSTAPIQNGGFANYNKVNNPYEISLRMIKTGSLESRKKFLAQIDAVAGSLELFKILTPEKTYLNCNILAVELVREEGAGAYMFAEVEITFIEVRIVEAQYTTTAVSTQDARNPSAQPPTNQGLVQPEAVPPSTAVAAAGVN